MKPSEKAIEAASKAYYPDGYFASISDRKLMQITLIAAYAIDVGPLLAAKDAEIERLNGLLGISDSVIGKGRERIAELKAEIDRLKAEYKSAIGELVDVGNSNYKRGVQVDELEAALRQQRDECERFHKPA